MHTQLEISKATGLTMAELETAQRAIARVMSTYRLPPGAAARELVGMSAVDDQRVATWRVRLRVFDNSDTLLADSDDGAATDDVGETVVRGVAGAFSWACDCVLAFQPTVNAADLMTAFDKRAPTLRVAVSRGGGRGRITAPYIANDQAYFARLDFSRESGPA